MLREYDFSEYRVFVPLGKKLEKRGLILCQRVWSIGGCRTSFAADPHGANAGRIATRTLYQTLAEPFGLDTKLQLFSDFVQRLRRITQSSQRSNCRSRIQSGLLTP